MIQNLRTSTPGVKQVWLADDYAGGGQIVELVQSTAVVELVQSPESGGKKNMVI